jgi:endonuclease/exonuclease/phosphatase family metal-dependent hydrolase
LQNGPAEARAFFADHRTEKFNHLETLLGKLYVENIEYYLVGDLNCDLSSTVLNHSSRLLIDITETYNLQQLITEQTRITNSSSTLIDHIFTNAPDRVVCSGVSHISISDHSLVYMPLENFPLECRQEDILQ